MSIGGELRPPSQMLRRERLGRERPAAATSLSRAGGLWSKAIRDPPNFDGPSLPAHCRAIGVTPAMLVTPAVWAYTPLCYRRQWRGVGSASVCGVTMRRCGLVVIGVITGSLVGVSSASACGGNNPCGLVVAHGVSPGGQRWSQTAGLNGTQPVVELSLPQPDGEDAGGGSAGPAPSARAPLISVGRGNGLGPAEENEVDGVAFQNVARLLIRFRTGAPTTVAVRQAPSHDRHRLAFLRPLRFFVVFFPSSRVPTTIRALSRSRQVLARLPRRGRTTVG